MPPRPETGFAGANPAATTLCGFDIVPTLSTRNQWFAPDLEIADMAARIRAMHGLRTPDALQAATAVRSHVTGFVTNHPVFERIDLFETLVLDRVL